MHLPKFSFGVGDRFAMQAEAQLAAIKMASGLGVEITPVWNKSNREHLTIHSEPAQTRQAVEIAVKNQNWTKPYFYDADHINMSNVDKFINHCDFFTIDVADFIGKKASDDHAATFVNRNKQFCGSFEDQDGILPYNITPAILGAIAHKFLIAIQEAGRIYRYIEKKKGKNNFVAEISMDEVNEAQTPVELFFILSMIATEGIPVQTIAPRFTGRFNKGVDYVGDVSKFEREFEQDLLVLDKAIKIFGLPPNLKLSIHSGSDKFTIYPSIARLIKKLGCGIHVKTAGTTWLEEVIGLALAGGAALQFVKSIYFGGFERFEELCSPYATVIDIDRQKLPPVNEVMEWDGSTFACSLRHIKGHSLYNPNFRQLMHVAYKLAAERGDEYKNLILQNKELVASQVVENIFERHLKVLFGQ